MNEQTSIEEKKKILQSKETQEWISTFLDEHKGDVDLSEDEFQKLKEIIELAQAVYNYSGEDTGISDEVYDILYEKLDMLQDGIDMTVSIVDNKLKVGYHKYPSLRGTLDKIYYLTEEDGKEAANKSRKGLPEWIAASERKIKEVTGKDINLKEEEIYVFPKWDGVSCIFEFDRFGKLQRALTRGFTETNEAQIVTHIFEGRIKGPWDNRDYPYGIKTEIMMTEDDLYRYNETYHTNYKNSRSIVSSIMNSDECDERVNYLQVMSLRTSSLINGEETLQTLTPGAFDRPYIRCRLCDTDIIKEFAFSHKYINGLRCDGAVIYIINEKIQKILGRENNKQKFEVAFKFTEETSYSKVKGIHFTTGLFGRINPVLEIKPIKMKGNTIENISLGSFARFKDLKLAKGDIVKVLYDIIPYAVFDETDPNCSRSNNDPFEAPQVCPDCGKPLMIQENGAILYCENKKCPCRRKGKILNYLNKMHIDNISYATVEVLYDEGYLKEISDLYRLKDHRKALEKMDGFGKQSVSLILDSIYSNMEIPETQLLGSIGIEDVSTKTFEKILSEITFDELIDYAVNDEYTAINVLASIPGIKDKKAKKIVKGINENIDLILELEDYLTVIPYKKSRGKFNVCFTKIRDEELEKMIEANGGNVVDTVTKDTDVVIVPMKGVTSSKVTKAEKYDIPIVPIDDAEAFIKDMYL